jgi:hypothetical protein
MITGYSLSSCLILILNLLTVPRILPRLFREDKWTVSHRIVWILWLVFAVGLGNYLFAAGFNLFVDFYHLGLETFLLFQLITVLIAIFPITIHTILNQNYLLRRNLREAAVISTRLSFSPGPKDEEKDRNAVDLVAENSKERLQCHPSDLLYLKAAGNYVEVILRTDKGPSRLIRNTLGGLGRQLSDVPYYFRCHRAYIINLLHVRSVTGNAQGLRLTLDSGEEKIPVSRGRIGAFKKQLERLQPGNSPPVSFS